VTRRKRHQNRKRRTSARPSEPQLPGNFRRAIERWERLAPILSGHPDLPGEIESRRKQLVEILAPFDAVAVLGQLVLSEMSLAADTYVESEHPGVAYVVEMAAAVLVSRSDRLGSEAVSPAIDANVLGPLRELIVEMALLEGLARYQRTAAHTDDERLAGAQRNAAIAHLVLRGPGWPWQETALLADLFAPFSSELRDALGFDAADAVACSKAAGQLVPQRFSEHMRNADSHVQDALDWADAVLGGGWRDQPPGPVRDRALAAIWALMHAGEAMLLDQSSLASGASVPTTVAHAYMEALSTQFAQTGALFDIAERIRFAPYLPVGHDRFFLTVPGNDLWALRPLFERTLKGERYARHRGRWLEQRATALLREALAPDEVHSSVKIFAPDGGTELSEIDGLLRFGDTILAVEAKSATMRPGARRGGRALISHLKATLTKASEQAALAKQVLQGEQTATLRRPDGAALVLTSPVREVHPILVTLDDLSSVAPTVWEIAGSTILPAGVTAPWILTLHELELVCATVESPIQLAHFLRARSRMNQLGGRVASEELDWWMLYLKQGLYFEHEPQPGRVRYLSQTDDLDAWILFEHGERERPAPKPRQRLDDTTRRVLTILAGDRPPGWVSAGCMLLSAGTDSREEIWRDLAAARRRARRKQLVQRHTYGYLDEPEPMLICSVVVPDGDGPHILTTLQSYVEERMAENSIRRVLGLGFEASSKRPFEALLIVDDAIWTLPDDD